VILEVRRLAALGVCIGCTDVASATRFEHCAADGGAADGDQLHASLRELAHLIGLPKFFHSAAAA